MNCLYFGYASRVYRTCKMSYCDPPFLRIIVDRFSDHVDNLDCPPSVNYILIIAQSAKNVNTYASAAKSLSHSNRDKSAGRQSGFSPSFSKISRNSSLDFSGVRLPRSFLRGAEKPSLIKVNTSSLITGAFGVKIIIAESTFGGGVNSSFRTMLPSSTSALF